MNKVFYPELSDQEDEVYPEREREIEKEENFMNLWGYLRRRYPNETLEEKIFSDSFASCLVAIKIIVNGWETEAIPEPTNQNAGKIGFLSKIFRNFS